jgi:ribose transport system substrate-binding protein
MKRIALPAALLIGIILLAGGDHLSAQPVTGKVKLAFITNNSSGFWTICKKGADLAVKEQPNIDLDFRITADATASAQKQIIQDLLAKGTQGIAISPEDADKQTDTLNSVASQALLICSDSDAAKSKRVCYIGTDNEAAGEQAGQEILKALPDGGKIMLFVGDLGAQNAHDRKAGIEKALTGSKVTIIDTRTDDADHQRAKTNAEDTITKYPDISAMVGLWSYNGPAIVDAVTSAKKIGQIKVICFDEEDGTLKGLQDGVVTSTIVQNPYEFGHQSMLFMYKYLTETDHSFVPKDGKIIVPTRVITKDTVDAFWTDLKAKRGN